MAKAELMTALALMFFAWAIESLIGWPDAVFRRIRHPVVWIGTLISFLDQTLNQSHQGQAQQRVLGAVTVLIVVAVTTLAALTVSFLLPNTFVGYALEVVIASSLIASRSLYQYVKAVVDPLAQHDLPAARQAVGHIVGRDPSQLDEAGIARAGLESLAENASDGVIAPLFWGAFFGLPGIAAYKAINTLDSMIAHKTERHQDFGCVAARLDDVVNFVPARLTGLLICLSSFREDSFRIMFRDAKRHRSPNAGYPEAALAGALNIRLSGPRIYEEGASSEPWLNASANDPTNRDMRRGLTLYYRAMGLGAMFLLVFVIESLWR